MWINSGHNVKVMPHSTSTFVDPMENGQLWFFVTQAVGFITAKSKKYWPQDDGKRREKMWPRQTKRRTCK